MRRVAVQDLVDHFAAIGWRRAAQQRCGASRRCCALDQFHPRIDQTVGSDQLADVVVAAGVARIGIHHHQHRIAGRPGLDELRELADIGATCRQVARFNPGIGVRVVDVQQHAVGQAHAHVTETLRGQAVGAVALVPLDPGEVVEGIVAERVEPVAERGTATGGSTVGMRVASVKRGVVVEVFLHVDQPVRRQFRCEQCGVGGRRSAGQAFGQAGDVVGQHVEYADVRLRLCDACAGKCESS